MEATGGELKELVDALAETPEVDMDALAMVAAKVGPWLLSMGGKLLLALVIFLIGRKIIGVIKKMMNRSLERADIDVGVARFLRALLEFSLNIFLVFIIAGQLGVDSASIVAVLGAAGLALSLALQGSLENFAGGVLILVMKPYRVGDYIICPEGEGTVSMVGLVYTTLMTIDNRAITIPNGKLSNSTVTNVTAMEYRRLDLKVGIGYRADLKRAKSILETIYKEHPAVINDRGITVYVDSLDESAVVLGARGWVTAEDYWTTRWDILEKIKLTFDETGIEIPFNQLDVHITQ
ncbi:MAG: mechanosensitive ion channel family protein [Clostridium sp.]